MASPKKIAYEKPEALDLGAVAPIVGQSCAEGLNYGEGKPCRPTGNQAVGGCFNGQGDTLFCFTGSGR